MSYVINSTVAMGLDVGSVNCGRGVIKVWPDDNHTEFNISMIEALSGKVPYGIKADPIDRIKFIEGYLQLRGVVAHTLTILGIEGFTNQQKSFTSFSTGEMGGYVRYASYYSDRVPNIVIIPPMFLNAFCGANKRGTKQSERKKIIKKYLQEHCSLEDSNEHATDALGFAWLAYLAYTYKGGYELSRTLIKKCVGRKIHIIEKLQDDKYWLKYT